MSEAIAREATPSGPRASGLRALARRARRLRAMSAPEIGHRLREIARREAESISSICRGRGEDAPIAARPARLPADFAPPGVLDREGLRAYVERAAERFFVPSGAEARRAAVAFVERRFPEWIAGAAAEAEALCAHRVELLGDGVVDLGATIDWHRDPTTGFVWPRRFWARYDLVGDDATADPKRVHELNRHQHVARLAKAALLCDEPRYAAEAVAQLLGWIEQNPPGVGVHWHSSLEIALRSTAWLWTLCFLPSGSVADAALESILASWCAQLDHVRRFPSTYSSPNTHLLGEATALVLAGLVFHDGAWGRRCLREGRRLLLEAVDRQVNAEGAHCELSLYYHCYALDFCLQALVLARRSGDTAPGAAGLATALREPLAAMCEFLAELVQPDGTLPLLGDDDGGRALGLAATDYRAPGDLLGAGAVLFGSEACRARSGEFREECFWLLGAGAWQAQRAQRNLHAGALRASFAEAGYFVQRSGWSRHDSQLIFDCGGLGAPSGGHGHADALAITLSAAGRPLLVDPGTYVYNRAPEWRRHFRSTRAHNTASIDGRDQSVPAGTFAWGERATCRLVDDLHFEAVDYVAGEHDGFARGPHGVVHRRRVLYARPHYWLIADDFRGSGEHTFEVFYHLAPGVAWNPEVSWTGGPASRQGGARFDARLESAGLMVSFHASSPFEVELSRAGEERPEGWVSARYGRREAGSVVCVRLRAAAPASVVAVLAPYELAADVAAPEQANRLLVHVGEARTRGLEIAQRAGAEGGLAVEIRERQRHDVLLLPPEGSAIDAFGCHGSGELLWARFDGDRLTRFLAVRAARFAVGGAELVGGRHPFTGYSADNAWRAGRRAGSRETSPRAFRTEEDRRVRHRWHR